MQHRIYRIVSFKIVGDYMLDIQFDDGARQSIDFYPILNGEMFGPLRDLSIFNRVKIDPEIHTLVWPNGADFDPETLHDWPKYEKELVARARQWDSGSMTKREWQKKKVSES